MKRNILGNSMKKRRPRCTHWQIQNGLFNIEQTNTKLNCTKQTNTSNEKKEYK